MSDQRQGGIAWTDETWNPVKGCSRVSEGCRNCYAERVAGRMATGTYRGLVKLTPQGPRWTGQLRLDEHTLTRPLYWKRPRRVFVNSMSDLFHENLASQDIAKVFAAMALSRQHQFQVLTKRADRMLAWFQGGYMPAMVREQIAKFRRKGLPMLLAAETMPWPLPNVWLGVSVEDQATADARIPRLLQVPAAIHWVSYEPALGPVQFYRWLMPDWIVVGGESGPEARPFDLAWARSTIEQGKADGVPVFVKQMGEHPHEHRMGRVYCRRFRSGLGNCGGGSWSESLAFQDRKGKDMAEWPADLQVREWPR